LDRTDDLYFDRVSQIRMPKWSQGRIALVGDAAYCVSLVAGQGSALAMIGAYVLAGELARAAGATAKPLRIMKTGYERSSAPSSEAPSVLPGVFAPKTRLGLWLRNQVIRSAAIPGIARLAFGRDIIDRLRLPDYRWGEFGRQSR